MQNVNFKRGDTFIPDCTFIGPSGVAEAYAALGITIKSQVRDASRNLIATLAVTAGAGTGEFSLESPSTQDWPIGDLYWDVQFTQGAHVFSTVTTRLRVADDVTQ